MVVTYDYFQYKNRETYGAVKIEMCLDYKWSQHWRFSLELLSNGGYVNWTDGGSKNRPELFCATAHQEMKKHSLLTKQAVEIIT